MLNVNLMKKFGRSINLPLLIALMVLAVTVGRNLNPFALDFFSYHDVTQSSRIEQFTKELTQLHIPPQIAPDYAFGNGYPVFTFYAPTAYWITSMMHLIGFEISQAIKLSFLLSILTAFGGMYTLASRVSHDKVLRLVPAFLYAASPWIASEIFVRGNLAEIWFIALLPWGVWGLQQKNRALINSLVLAGLFTSHNALSLIAIIFCFIVAIVQTHRKAALQVFFIALVLSVYFWIPVVFGLSGTYAQDIAQKTDFSDHFLCVSQLWTSNNGWGYGGSAPGCDRDGISFMIGKFTIIFAFAVVFLFISTLLYQVFSRKQILKRERRRDIDLTSIVIVLLGLLSLFLTLKVSQPVWEGVSLMKSFQFPWRFVAFILFAASYISVYIFNYVRLPLYITRSMVLVICAVILILNAKFFVGQLIAAEKVYSLYSTEFVWGKAAYAIPEYLPRTIDLSLWNSLRMKTPMKNELDLLKTQFNAYKPPTVLYTISHAVSFGALGYLLCHHIYRKIQKKA